MKHKKSLFITTVMMVVLLVVALSTATFAWYTSSNVVSTVETTVNSAESTGANISIGWIPNTPVGVSSLEFYTSTDQYDPMVPTIPEAVGTFSFTKDTLFHTAMISHGELSAHVEATPYVGQDKEDGGEDTFYIVNYARRATEITFTANVRGENAARLRVAVFKADSGEVVFTNADLYWGMVMEPVAAKFTLTESKPADWEDNYADYSSDGEVFTAVAEVAPEFVANNVWNQDGEVQTIEPVGWADNYADYSSNPNFYDPIKGVAPTWAAETFYAYTDAVDEYLSAPVSQKLTKVSEATTIAASDGVTGEAQGFIVKAWFDGPTQVDAYGGQNATFTLTARAT